MAELYELRYVIEPTAASLAATHATAADIEQLRSAYEAMAAAGDDRELIVAPDVNFHRAIIAASGNALFSSLSHVIGDALAINFQVGLDNPRGQMHSLPLHKKVMDAIVAHDSGAARAAMQKLIEDSERDVRLIRMHVRAIHSRA
jgi:DNA-binding FadR family transcriptional regulator